MDEMSLDDLIDKLNQLRQEVPGTTPVMVATFDYEDPQPARQVTWQKGILPVKALHIFISG